MQCSHSGAACAFTLEFVSDDFSAVLKHVPGNLYMSSPLCSQETPLGYSKARRGNQLLHLISTKVKKMNRHNHKHGLKAKRNCVLDQADGGFGGRYLSGHESVGSPGTEVAVLYQSPGSHRHLCIRLPALGSHPLLSLWMVKGSFVQGRSQWGGGCQTQVLGWVLPAQVIHAMNVMCLSILECGPCHHWEVLVQGAGNGKTRGGPGCKLMVWWGWWEGCARAPMEAGGGPVIAKRLHVEILKYKEWGGHQSIANSSVHTLCVFG